MVDGTGQRTRPSDPWLDDHSDLLGPGKLALDLGAGSGEDAAELTERGLSVIAFDQSLYRLRRARMIAPEARFVRGDMTKPFPFDDGVFDVVVASLSLHYFDWETSQRIVAEVSRVLRPGGWLIARVNRVGDVHFDYGVGREVEPEYFEVHPGHFKRFFTASSLRRLLMPSFNIDRIDERASWRWGKEKKTLMARARTR